jgi:hypothetical protein
MMMIIRKLDLVMVVMICSLFFVKNVGVHVCTVRCILIRDALIPRLSIIRKEDRMSEI